MNRATATICLALVGSQTLARSEFVLRDSENNSETDHAVASLRNESVEVEWLDGKVALLDANWLRERCVSNKSVDSETKQPLFSPHELPEHVSIADVRVMEDVEQQKEVLEVIFNDGHRSKFGLRGLRAELSEFDKVLVQVEQYDKVPQILWRGSDFKIGVFQHAEVETQASFRKELLRELLVSGMALVRGVPREAGQILKFAATLSQVRSTGWGPLFNVRSVPDSTMKDLAYTPKRIGLHTDGPYMFNDLGFQLLHAIDHCWCPNDEAPCDGCSVINYNVDGFYVAEKLRHEDPAAFKILTEVPVRWENDGGDGKSAFVTLAPHLELERPWTMEAQASERPQLRSVRFSAKSGQYAPPLAPAALREFYRARRRFSEMLHDPVNMVSLQFAPGDLLIFDNSRLLHARSEIRPTDGERWVQGCYIDRDGVWDNYERLRRSI